MFSLPDITENLNFLTFDHASNFKGTCAFNHSIALLNDEMHKYGIVMQSFKLDSKM